jgi:hypothetical protein
MTPITEQMKIEKLRWFRSRWPIEYGKAERTEEEFSFCWRDAETGVTTPYKIRPSDYAKKV